MTKHILITGGNRGLGLACIKLILSSSSCSSDKLHILMGTRNIEAGERAISGHLLQYKNHHEITPICIDVTDKISIANAVEKVRSISPKLSVLINNAGILDGPNVIKTNYQGVLDVTDAFLPLLLENENDDDDTTTTTLPYIIATSSSAGTRFMSSLPQHQSQQLLSEELTIDNLTSTIDELANEKDVDIYSLSKCAVNCHTQIIARKYKNRLNAIAVSPGFTNTGMCVNYTGKRQPKSVELGASVFYEALCGLGKGKSGIFLKQNSSAGTPVEDAETVETEWST